MRQTVSYVKDGHVRYYVSEGEQLEEVARVRVSDRFTPEATVALGLNITNAVGPISFARPETPAAAIAATGEAGKGEQKKKGGKSRKPRANRSDLTYDMVLDAVRSLPPGSPTSDIIARLGITEEVVKKTVVNRLGGLRERGDLRSEKRASKAYWYLTARHDPPLAEAGQIIAPTLRVAEG
jgi:hypothetical protein